MKITLKQERLPNLIFFSIFESSGKIILVSAVVIPFYIPLNINNIWQQYQFLKASREGWGWAGGKHVWRKWRPRLWGPFPGEVGSNSLGLSAYHLVLVVILEGRSAEETHSEMWEHPHVSARVGITAPSFRALPPTTAVPLTPNPEILGHTQKMVGAGVL